MKSKKVWIIAIIIIIALAGAAFFFRNSVTAFTGSAAGQTQSQAQTQGNRSARTGGDGAAQAEGNSPAQTDETVLIRPAADVNQVSAAGNIALAGQQAGVLQVEGTITELAVEPGDSVAAGDLLVALDTVDLERAVERAKLNLLVTQNELAQLQEPADEAEIDAAWANLAAAKENLAELQAGPGPAELEAARAALTAAQVSYQELLDGQSEAELTQLSAELHRAFITLRQAQEAYNEIAYRGDIGQTQQAMDLQTATIDYDVAKAGLDIATEPASAAEIQEALRAIKEAQAQLEDLAATPAELASAQAQVAEAEASLATLLNGPGPAELGAAELAIEEAQLDVDEALADLERAQLHAPIHGVILTVEVEVGQQATAGLSALTLADLTNLELPVFVAEVDIRKVELGQPANISVDALPDQTFQGEVSRIVPISQPDSGVVNYEVTIQLNDLDLEDGVLPGMTAVATILGESSENAWLVPTNALVEFEGEVSVLLVRNGQERRVTVTPGESQGEWTVVQSEALQARDRVVGQVSSFLDEEGGGGPRFFGGRPPR